MDSIKKLEAYFAEFPGIGPRQAKRFVYFLLHKNSAWSGDLSRLISEIHGGVAICGECFRIFPKPHADSAAGRNAGAPLCPICASAHREKSLLMIVARDIDLDAVEKSGVYDGLYFVLGGTVPILEKEPERKVRLSELKQKIERAAAATDPLLHIKEIVIALSANPEGENTGEFIESKLAPLTEKYSIRISYLGRGLSTGSELEYSDKETLKNALVNRK